MTDCPACRSYTVAECRAIANAGREHHSQLDAIRRAEARAEEPEGPYWSPFASWGQGPDAMRWRPA